MSLKRVGRAQNSRFGSTMQVRGVSSVWESAGFASRRSPVRSRYAPSPENSIWRTFLGSVSTFGNSGASAVRADRRIAVESSRMRSSHGACLPESGHVESRRRPCTPEVAACAPRSS